MSANLELTPTYVTTLYRAGVSYSSNDAFLSSHKLRRGPSVDRGMAYKILSSSGAHVDTMRAMKAKCTSCGTRIFGYVFNFFSWTLTCSKCSSTYSGGIDLLNTSNLAPAPAAPAPAPATSLFQAPAPQEKLVHSSTYHYYEYAESLAKKLAEHFGISLTVRMGHGRISYAQRTAGGAALIINFAASSVTRAHETGFCEYRTVEHVWRRAGTLNYARGIWALVLHEFAHILVWARHGTGCRPHGREFQSTLKELIALFGI